MVKFQLVPITTNITCCLSVLKQDVDNVVSANSRTSLPHGHGKLFTTCQDQSSPFSLSRSEQILLISALTHRHTPRLSHVVFVVCRLDL